MIIGSAGHIDHGKTALIRALTGVDADRLAEEKKRGLTIDLGFAYQPQAGGEVLGFVDVPGHEKFVANMLSGALAVDYVMLVVAADDGPMPQSREHLAILDLLGLDRGVVALTKIDRVDADRCAEARIEVRAMLAGTSLASADIVPVSAITGDGVAVLHERLLAVAADRSPRRRDGYFRLAADRSFSLSGTGTVVTGSVHSGEVRIGDELTISPQGVIARVRSIHRQGQQADTAGAGDRCALNLTGRRLDRQTVHRGDWVLAAPVHAPSARLDGLCRVLAEHDRKLAHWTPVHVHIGAADIPGRLAVLDGDTIAPGERGRVQLVLDHPVPALHGDRFIVRDQSATRTIGGGWILDAFAPGRGRRRPVRLGVLDALAAATPGHALSALLQCKAIAGLDLDWFARLFNLRPDDLAALEAASGLFALTHDGRRLGFAADSWDRLCRAILDVIDQQHQRAPASAGLAESALAAATGMGLGQRPPAVAVAAAVGQLLETGALARSGRRLALPSHRVKLTPPQQALWNEIEPRLRSGGLRPPRVRELVEILNESHDLLSALMRQQAAAGAVWQVSDELYYARAPIAALAADTQHVAEADAGRLTVKSFREGTGARRNVAVELLEFFDRTGLTSRVADGRRLLGDARRLFGAPDQAK